MFAPEGIPDVRPGDDLCELLAAALEAEGATLEAGDILVVAHKIVSKAEGRIVRLADVQPGREAIELADKVGKCPAKVEVILGESNRVLRAVKHPNKPEGVLIAEHRLGFVCANAAVDESNVGEDDAVILLPEDPDRSARELCAALERRFDVPLGLIIADTFGRPWRVGLVNVTIGLANVPSCVDLAGQKDAYGRVLAVTTPAFADELAAASGLLMSKSGKQPVVVFRGVEWTRSEGSARDFVRPHQEDLFR